MKGQTFCNHGVKLNRLANRQVISYIKPKENNNMSEPIFKTKMDQIKGVMTKTAMKGRLAGPPSNDKMEGKLAGPPSNDKMEGKLTGGKAIPEFNPADSMTGQGGKRGGKTMKDLIEAMKKHKKGAMPPTGNVPPTGKPPTDKPKNPWMKPAPAKPRPMPGRPMPGRPGLIPGKPKRPYPGIQKGPDKAIPLPGKRPMPGAPNPMRPLPGKPKMPGEPNYMRPMGKQASADELAIIEYAFNDELSKLAAKGTVFSSAIKAIKGVGKKLKGLGVKFDKQVQRVGNKISDKVGLPKVKSGIQNAKSGKTKASKVRKSYQKRLAKRGRQVGYGTAGAAAAAGYGLKKALD